MMKNTDKITMQQEYYNEEVYCDFLTGAYNRRFLREQLPATCKAVGIAMIDLDDFKAYNDTYGHHAGDLVLQTTALTIKENIRKNDFLIRYGGDEFLLVMPDMRKEFFKKKLIQIQQKIYEAVVPEYGEMYISASIGGAVAQDEQIETVIDRADKLMYLAKSGKNQVVTEEDVSNGKVSEEKMCKKQMILMALISKKHQKMLRDILEDGYCILEAVNEKECLEMLKQYRKQLSMVLLDLSEEESNGIDILKKMKESHRIKEIPVLIISEAQSESYVRKAFELGASDYISPPFEVEVVYQRINNTIHLYAKQRHILRILTDHVREKEKNERLTIGILSQIVEFRDIENGIHAIHMNLITDLLIGQLVRKTNKYTLSRSEQEMIVAASVLHDIGKIGIDAKILRKKTKLTEQEYKIVKQHTVIGSAMLENMAEYKTERLIQIAYEICRWHHERWDGKGYPDGLKGDETPISAQVVALADVYDTLICAHVYKSACNHEDAVQKILDGEYGAFNPILLECLLDVQEQLKTEI